MHSSSKTNRLMKVSSSATWLVQTRKPHNTSTGYSRHNAPSEDLTLHLQSKVLWSLVLPFLLMDAFCFSAVEDSEQHLWSDRENHLWPPDEPVGLLGRSPADQYQAGRGFGKECWEFFFHVPNFLSPTRNACNVCQIVTLTSLSYICLPLGILYFVFVFFAQGMYIKSTYDGLHVITGTTEHVSITLCWQQECTTNTQSLGVYQN